MVKRILSKEALIELKSIKENSVFNNNLKNYEDKWNIIIDKLSLMNMS